MSNKLFKPSTNTGLKWAKRIFVGFFSLILLLIIMGAIYQTGATWLDESDYPPPGKLYDIGGYKLHAKVTGQGTVTVVMDAGLMNTHLTWVTVESQIAKFAQVLTYDRAGYAWSDAGPEPRSSAQIALELHNLLAAADIQPPYVLVGHSMGGINVRTFASQYPQEVAGMVLIDSSHEDQINRIPDEASQMLTINILAAMAPVGLARLLLPGLMFDNLKDPVEVIALRPSVAAKSLSTKHIFTMRDEYSAFEQRLGDLPSVPPSFGDKPLIVITHDTQTTQTKDMSNAEYTEIIAWNRIWDELQAELAATSSKSKLVIAKGSEHMVHVDRPDLVIDAIQLVVEQVASQLTNPSM